MSLTVVRNTSRPEFVKHLKRYASEKNQVKAYPCTSQLNIVYSLTIALAKAFNRKGEYIIFNITMYLKCSIIKTDKQKV